MPPCVLTCVPVATSPHGTPRRKWQQARPDVSSAVGARLQHASAHLVELDRFKQRLEVAFAEAFVALALDELEKDRSKLILRKDLQQQIARLAVNEDPLP